MSKELNLYQLKTASVETDIRAEVVAADLVEAGVEIDDIVIGPAGPATRFYGRDIVHIEAQQDKLGLHDFLNISVSREGLYNSLPEALFHIFDRGKKDNASHFVEEYKKHKAEEEAAKQFFLAFEKEIYRLRTCIELNERKSIFGFSEQFKSDLFLDLWPELRDIDEKYQPALILILPVAHKVIGNVQLAELLLSYILNQPISITINDLCRSTCNFTNSACLGLNYLGEDVVIGSELPIFTPLIQIKVGPVKKRDLVGLMPGGSGRRALDLACKYLLPVFADIEVVMLLDNDSQTLILSDDRNEGILGLSSCI